MEFNSNSQTWNNSNQNSPDGSQNKKCCQFKHKKTIITLIVLGLIICFCLMAYFNLSKKMMMKPTAQISTLKLTSVLFRHGERTPTKFCESDPFKNFDWPEGVGGLTNAGKMQTYNLGMNIRSRYGNYLPTDYRENDIYVFSSDLPRTLMSAYTFLAGLYPPSKRQQWNPDLNWQPIPVHTKPRLDDDLIALKKSCKAFSRHYNETKQSAYVKNILNKNDDLLKYLSLHCNQTVRTPLDVEVLYATLKAEREYGFGLPLWTDSVFPDSLTELTATSYEIYTHTDEMKRLKGGPLLSKIIENMKQKHMKKLYPDRKMFIYSGHDLTITTLMNTIGFRMKSIPDYAAAFIIELHHLVNTTDSEVRMFYMKNSTQLIAEELPIPLCDAPCDLEKFINITGKYIPKNWEQECESIT